MAGGYALSRMFGFNNAEAMFIGTILTATSVTITAQALMNLNQLRSKVGSTILGAAVIDDVLGLIVLSVVIALAPQMTGASGMSWRAPCVDFRTNGALSRHHCDVWPNGHALGFKAGGASSRPSYRDRGSSRHCNAACV